MEIDYQIVGIVAIVIILLIIFLIRRNRKDQKDFEEEVGASEIKPNQHDETKV
jgi:preprotein translocase subunit YajC